MKYLTEFVKISKAKIGDDYYICFRNTEDKLGYSLSNHNCISANQTITILGMRCTDYKFFGRKAYRIKDGLAVKMYE